MYRRGNIENRSETKTVTQLTMTMLDNKVTADTIFDLDGTLIDSAQSILLCLGEALASQGIVPKLPLSPMLIGPPLRETLRALSGCANEKTIAAMVEIFTVNYDSRGFRATTVFPGIDETLRNLKAAGQRLHIATNKRLRPTQLILSHLGWAELFSSVYSLDLFNTKFVNKSEMLGALLVNQKINSNAAIYIGDRAGDRDAAHANALEFVAATWGYEDEDLLTGKEPLVVAQKPEDLLRIISGNGVL